MVVGAREQVAKSMTHPQSRDVLYCTESKPNFFACGEREICLPVYVG